ncbi:ATP-binding protein [Petrachloros mirabilis]
MRIHISNLIGNAPIRTKFLLISVIPLAALILLSVMTYRTVETLSLDEDRLDNLYRAQKSAAQYMRLVVDLETGFRGYVLTEELPFLRPYGVAQEGIVAIGKDLESRISKDQLQQFKIVQKLVAQLMKEKDELISAIKAGHKTDAIHYIEAGRGRALMVEIRERMMKFDQLEQQRVAEELTLLSEDRTRNLYVILFGGVLTFGFIVGALYLIARSITVPLVSLAKDVGSAADRVVPTIPVLDRKDEIGDLTRVMHAMSSQIRGHLDQVEKSESALRRVNESLAQSESRYRGLVDHAPLGIFTTLGTQVTFSNRYNQILAGLDPDEEVDPGTFRERIHPEDRDRVLAEFEQAVGHGRPHETVFRFVHLNGGTLKVLSRRIPLTHDAGPRNMYVGFNIDITALEDLQFRLSRSEKLATLGQVAAGIAHEIRNPLIGIGSTASLLVDEFEESDSRRNDISEMLKETKRLDRIVNQIVEFARPRELAVVAFALQDLVEEVLKLLAVSLQDKRVSVKLSIPPTLGMLHADRDQLKQVLLNLVQNALEASPEEGGVLEITAFELMLKSRSGIMIKVKDSGKGIPADLLPHVFEPFFTRGKPRGTGLGLAICRNIVENHMGELHMTSDVGKGTVVSLWLPLKPETKSGEV